MRLEWPLLNEFPHAGKVSGIETAQRLFETGLVPGQRGHGFVHPLLGGSKLVATDVTFAGNLYQAADSGGGSSVLFVEPIPMAR